MAPPSRPKFSSVRIPSCRFRFPLRFFPSIQIFLFVFPVLFPKVSFPPQDMSQFPYQFLNFFCPLFPFFPLQNFSNQFLSYFSTFPKPNSPHNIGVIKNTNVLSSPVPLHLSKRHIFFLPFIVLIIFLISAISSSI